MTSHGDTPRRAADSGAKCPATVKALIVQALAAHLREQGNCNWGLVRERPEFAPYIGAIAGETGKKRFQRWKKKLTRPLPKDRTRPHEARSAVEAQFAWAKETADAADTPENMLPITVRQIMGKGLSALRGYEYLSALLQQSSDDLERIRQTSLAVDPDGLGGLAAANPELLLKVARENRELVQAMTAFVRQYTELWEGEQFIEDVVELVGEVLADQPTLHQSMLTGLQDLQRRHGGIPAQRQRQ